MGEERGREEEEEITEEEEGAEAEEEGRGGEQSRGGESKVKKRRSGRKVAARIGFIHGSIEVGGVGNNGPGRKQVLRSGLT